MYVEYGIMRIVGVYRFGTGFYCKFSTITLQGPGIRSVPFFPVSRRIFEVPVLYQLGIKSSIGSIVDVLKKYTY